MVDQLTANGIPVYRDSGGVLREYTSAPSTSGASTQASDLDTDGNPVPMWKAHVFTYDDSGNLITDSVTNGVNVWIKSYTYTPSGPASDSGWVKQ